MTEGQDEHWRWGTEGGKEGGMPGLHSLGTVGREVGRE